MNYANIGANKQIRLINNENRSTKGYNMNAKTNQKQATYSAITVALSNAQVDFTNEISLKEFLAKESNSEAILKEAKGILFAGFRNDLIATSDEFKSTKVDNDALLSSYCSGLISNWSKKDSRLNGDVKFQFKNKGIRAGSGDAQVKELRKLLKQTSGTEFEAEVKESLDKRLSEIKVSKVQVIQINADLLPENLRHLVK